MTDPRPAAPRPSFFTRSWRWLLPAAIAVMALSLATGVFDSGATSAWIFALGAGLGIVGVISLATRLVLLGRARMQALERRIEDEIEEHGRGRR